MRENKYGGGFFYNYDWDNAVIDECVYPPGDCSSCPLRDICRKEIWR